VEKQVNDAITALIEGDESSLSRCGPNDNEINSDGGQIDEECMRILARSSGRGGQHLRLRDVLTRSFGRIWNASGDEASKNCQARPETCRKKARSPPVTFDAGTSATTLRKMVAGCAWMPSPST